jgi:hypothetical protein
MWKRFCRWLIGPFSGADFFLSVFFLVCMALLGMATSQFLSDIATKEDLKQAVSTLREEIRSQRGMPHKETGNKEVY